MVNKVTLSGKPYEEGIPITKLIPGEIGIIVKSDCYPDSVGKVLLRLWGDKWRCIALESGSWDDSSCLVRRLRKGEKVTIERIEKDGE